MESGVSQSRVRTDEIESAARVVVGSALRLSANERMAVITDRASSQVGFALAGAAERAGARVFVIDLDGHGMRPVKALPDLVVAELTACQASAFVASAGHAELGLRQHLLHVVKSFRLRHAHMPGITPLAFAHGMRIDYTRVRAHGQRLLEKLALARALEVNSAAGTRLQIELGPDTAWYPQLGVLEAGRWGNLPAGALYASPARIEGVFVANASVGEYFGQREGLLHDRPVRLSITAGRVRRVEVPRCRALELDIERMLGWAEGSDRVGLVAVGVNTGLTRATGEALVDQNLPGLHIAVGDPAARITGASYSAPTSFAACQSDATLLVDGVIAIYRGKLLSPS